MATNTPADGAVAQPVVQSTPPENVPAEPKTPSPAASGPSTGIEKFREMIMNPSKFRKVPAEKAVAVPSTLSLFGEPTLNIGTLPSASTSGEGSSAGKAVALSPATKRKTTDPNLKTVVIDPMYDLTVIVGTPDATDGQIAFRVNRGSLRHASDVWNKMLTGPWSENIKDQSEVEFPDDSAWAFEQVLYIAHLQEHKVPQPQEIDLSKLLSLAVLVDKYDLARVMRTAWREKDWAPLDQPQLTWSAIPIHQDWIYITHAFEYNESCAYLTNRLAVEVQNDKTDGSLYHLTGDVKFKLSADMPERVLMQIRDVRNNILQEWVKLCSTAFDKAIFKKDDDYSNPCGKAICRATRMDIMSFGLRAAGLCPATQISPTMYESVVWYWKALNDIGAEFKDYKPCDSTYGYGKGAHHSSCSYEKCLGDFGFLKKAEATLKQYGHKDVVSHLLSDKFLKPSV
ncbi:hypothetical protein E8E13_011295 [Curvularia kusanoi]|uniref:BTB domain-containing protein n=1 Tax=Curvularia kusanoi TaxID=90978 RepID=A0A9P4WDV9_CURKU|nr:hypothetical protein E8E13_011295 [Curvularia kusanoi]